MRFETSHKLSALLLYLRLSSQCYGIPFQKLPAISLNRERKVVLFIFEKHYTFKFISKIAKFVKG